MATNRVELLKQICPDCTKVMHKRCVLAANDGKDPCKECAGLLCDNCAALVACYDLCDGCSGKICHDCHTKAKKKNLNANFDKKCYDLLCGRCKHVLQCWCVRGIKTHLNELGISDSDSDSESSNSDDEKPPQKGAKSSKPKSPPPKVTENLRSGESTQPNAADQLGDTQGPLAPDNSLANTTTTRKPKEIIKNTKNAKNTKNKHTSGKKDKKKH